MALALTSRTRHLISRAKQTLAPALPLNESPSTLTPLAWNRAFLAHHVLDPHPADFHLWLDDHLRAMHRRRGSRTALIAPREGAKTTVITLGYVLRMAVERREPYILLLSDSSDQAGKFLAAIRGELEDNPALAVAYPDAFGRGSTWRGEQIRLRNGVLIESLGSGAAVRGRKDRQNRPTLIVVDDCQSNRDIISPIERDHALTWFLQEVIPAGASGCNFFSVGSALHRDCVSVRAQSLPGWDGRTFRAIKSWPERMDLWAEWERRATNLSDKHRGASGDTYLSENRNELLKGAVTFWPSYKPIQVLMARRAELGPRRFDTEYQGIPGSPEGSVFPPEYFDYAGFWFDDWPHADDEVMTVQALDPSKGATDKSDFQGHVVATLATDGTIYVDAVGVREPVPTMVSRALDLCEDHRPHCLAIETNQGLDLLLPEFARQAASRGLVAPIEGIENYSVGKRRIERLGSYLSRHAIRVRNTPGGRMLEEQLRDFPNADHDDLPDALEVAVRMLELLTGDE